MFWDLVDTIELDERYFDKTDLTKAVASKLTKEGKNCEVINRDTIIIEGYKFNVKERNYGGPVPVEQVILKKVKY